MLTLYEQKYKQEVQKFANEQVGRRRRDDYTDGTVRIPVNSANPQEIKNGKYKRNMFKFQTRTFTR